MQSAFSFPVSAFSSRCAGCGEREDEAMAVNDPTWIRSMTKGEFMPTVERIQENSVKLMMGWLIYKMSAFGNIDVVS